MDTVRVDKSTSVESGSRSSGALPYFIGGFVVMLIGLLVGQMALTGLGFVTFVVAFLFMNERIRAGIQASQRLHNACRDSRLMRG